MLLDSVLCTTYCHFIDTRRPLFYLLYFYRECSSVPPCPTICLGTHREVNPAQSLLQLTAPQLKMASPAWVMWQLD